MNTTLTDDNRGIVPVLGLIGLLLALFGLLLISATAVDNTSAGQVQTITAEDNSTLSVEEYLNRSHSIKTITITNDTISITTTKDPVLERGYAQTTYDGDISNIELSTRDGEYIESRPLRTTPRTFTYHKETINGQYILTLIDDPDQVPTLFGSRTTDENTEIMKITIQNNNVTEIQGEIYPPLDTNRSQSEA